MIKRIASIALIFGLAHAPTFAATQDAPPPLFKVTYGEIWGPSPLMYSYSVWPSGEVRYEPLSLDYNGVKIRQPRTLHVSPETALRAVNELIKAGFLALEPEVYGKAASKDGDAVSLDSIVITDSQKVTVEFHFQNADRKIELAYIEILPWAKPALQKVEKTLGITALTE
jgi:hypothetical protein